MVVIEFVNDLIFALIVRGHPNEGLLRSVQRGASSSLVGRFLHCKPDTVREIGEISEHGGHVLGELLGPLTAGEENRLEGGDHIAMSLSGLRKDRLLTGALSRQGLLVLLIALVQRLSICFALSGEPRFKIGPDLGNFAIGDDRKIHRAAKKLVGPRNIVLDEVVE